MKNHSDPLLEAGVFLAKFYHKPCSKEVLKKGLPLPNSGRLTPKLFIKSMECIEFNASINKRSLKKISKLVMPCVLILKNNKACILQSMYGEHADVILFDNENSKRKRVFLKELERQYAGYVIFVKPEYQLDTRGEQFHEKKERSWFWQAVWRYRYYYFQVFIAAFLINLFALASPLYVMNVYDRVVPNNAIETLWVLVIGVSLVYLFDCVIKLARGHLIDSIGKKVDALLANQIFSNVINLKMSHRPVSSGAFSNNLREFESLRDFFTSATLATLIDIPFISLFLIMIGNIGGLIVIIPLIAVPLVIISAKLISIPLAHHIENSMRSGSQKHALAVEALATLEATRCLSGESQLQWQWEQAVTSNGHSNYLAKLLSSVASHLTGWIIQMVVVFVVAFGVYRIEMGLMTMGGLIACTMLSNRVLAPLTQITHLLTRFQQAKSGLTSLNAIMRLPTEQADKKQFFHRAKVTGDLVFKEVSLTYPNEEMPVLKKINLTFKAGEKVGLLGRVGAGKTSLLKALMKLYDINSGTILIGGTDIRQLDPADLRKHVAYAPQENTLFFGTLKSNIIYGKPWIDDEAVLKAAQLSGVERFASLHPAGYEMPVAERGENLSGGQKKAVVMARLFLSDASILLLDEPSTAMDNASEKELIQSIQSFAVDKTLLLTTHKPALLALVDRLIIFEQGQIVADGPKDQVLQALAQQPHSGPEPDPAAV